jgi:hypothetical protein
MSWSPVEFQYKTDREDINLDEASRKIISYILTGNKKYIINGYDASYLLFHIKGKRSLKYFKLDTKEEMYGPAIMDLLWRLFMAKHELSPGDYYKRINYIAEIDDENVKSYDPSGKGNYMSGFFTLATGQIWNVTEDLHTCIAGYKKEVLSAPFLSVFHTAYYLLDLVGNSKEGPYELCSNYFDMDVVKIGLGLTSENKESIVNMYGMTYEGNEDTWSIQDVYEGLMYYEKRGYFLNLPREDISSWTNQEMANVFNLKDGFSSKRIRYIFDNFDTILTTPVWSTCYAGTEETASECRSCGEESTFWLEYGFPGDKLCFTVREIVNSYNSIEGYFGVPGWNDGYMDIPGIRSKMHRAFTIMQVIQLGELLDNNLENIHEDKEIASGLILLISRIDMNRAIRTDVIMRYNSLSEEDRLLVNEYFMFYRDRLLISSGSKLFTPKVENIRGSIAKEFIDSLYPINNKGEFDNSIARVLSFDFEHITDSEKEDVNRVVGNFYKGYMDILEI